MCSFSRVEVIAEVTESILLKLWVVRTGWGEEFKQEGSLGKAERVRAL
jgi:hypothetical protein